MKKSKIVSFVAVFALVFCVSATPLFAAKENAPESAIERQENVWAKIFPNGIMKAGQKSSTAKKENLKVLNGKFVGVYSSAKWCGYCHIFTPQLINFYKTNKSKLEIVFDSGDKSEEEMRAYVKSSKMKWMAAPFGKRVETQRASGGIPRLVVFSPDGEFFAEIVGAGGTEQKTDPRLADLKEKMDAWFAEHAQK